MIDKECLIERYRFDEIISIESNDGLSVINYQDSSQKLISYTPKPFLRKFRLENEFLFVRRGIAVKKTFIKDYDIKEKKIFLKNMTSFVFSRRSLKGFLKDKMND